MRFGKGEWLGAGYVLAHDLPPFLTSTALSIHISGTVKRSAPRVRGHALGNTLCIPPDCINGNTYICLYPAAVIWSEANPSV